MLLFPARCHKCLDRDHLFLLYWVFCRRARSRRRRMPTDDVDSLDADLSHGRNGVPIAGDAVE